MRKASFVTGLASAALVTGVALVPASAASAATYGPVTTNCGVVTCSAYLSRSATKAVNEKLTLAGGGYAGVGLIVCAPLAPPPLTPIGVACGVAATVQGAWIAQEVEDAAERHGARGACLKVTYTKPVGNVPPQVTYWSTNNGKYCKD
ncbi:hypothetical protein [Actinoplanes sp. NPDC089786]|uniref:hypothetical protein n=1 Tax=Actinoplanes sp. NPDC089786 TaxID=3155185 RepID=UPI0034291515